MAERTGIRLGPGTLYGSLAKLEKLGLGGLRDGGQADRAVREHPVDAPTGPVRALALLGAVGPWAALIIRAARHRPTGHG